MRSASNELYESGHHCCNYLSFMHFWTFNAISFEFYYEFGNRCYNYLSFMNFWTFTVISFEWLYESGNHSYKIPIAKECERAARGSKFQIRGYQILSKIDIASAAFRNQVGAPINLRLEWTSAKQGSRQSRKYSFCAAQIYMLGVPVVKKNNFFHLSAKYMCSFKYGKLPNRSSISYIVHDIKLWF